MFEIKNISKQYNGEFALKNVSATIGKGLNFVIGASGSGKTTLLKIISGMESSFEGEISYCGQNIKTMSEGEKSYYYSHIFGFVWQDFNLLDDLTVYENVVLPTYLQGQPNKKTVEKVLKDMKISELSNQRVKTLSGGQKQRVAIARELLKNPEVIIADEPTSALDEVSSAAIMDILRGISKTKTVIIVTHDTSLIDKKANVYELDKGELIAAKTPSENGSRSSREKNAPHRLAAKNAFRMTLTNMRRKPGRFVTVAASLMLSAVLLLVTFSGAIIDSGQRAFDELISTYGKGILDIEIVKSFMSAGGTDGAKDDKPNANVTQDIGGLYDKYLKDERIEHIVFLQPFNDIKIKSDGKEYKIESSNNVPVVNELTHGKMPMGDGKEIVVPKSFVQKMGIRPEDAIGKTISFEGSIFNWDSGQPVSMPVSVEVTIVGIADTTMKSEYNKEIIEYSIDDSFFFSKSALDDVYSQAKTKSNSNFSIRTKTPEDMIAIKDELNADGIVPLGRFELIEDMVRLNNQTTEQSSSAVFIIGILSVFVTVAISLITAGMRKREYAICKVSGFSKFHLVGMTTAETLFSVIVSAIIFLVCSPLINMATTAFWDVNILNSTMLTVGIGLTLAIGILFLILTAFTATNTKVIRSLKTGDR